MSVLHRRTMAALALGALLAVAPAPKAAGAAPELFDLRIFYGAPGRAPAVSGIRLVPGQSPAPVPPFTGAAQGGAPPHCTASLAGPAGLRQAVIACDACHLVLSLTDSDTGSGNSEACAPDQSRLSVFVHPVRPGARQP